MERTQKYSVHSVLIGLSALVIGAMLALSFAGGTQSAHAATGLAAGEQAGGTAAQPKQVSTTAKKTSIWVIVKDKSDDSTKTLTYTKNGLLKKYRQYGGTYTFAYDSKNRLKSMKYAYKGKLERTITYKRNGKGWVTKGTCKYPDNSYKWVENYKYNKKGQLTKYTGGYYGVTRKTLSYDKKGLLASAKVTVSDDGSEMTALKFSKGALVSDGQGNTYKNSFKRGRLVKQIEYDSYGEKVSTRTLSYKKISVPKSTAKMVKAQQAALKAVYQGESILPVEAAHK